MFWAISSGYDMLNKTFGVLAHFEEIRLLFCGFYFRHVVYVWLDALSNYITGLGYDPDVKSENYKKYWAFARGAI